jgi:putative toxin-antitoxin system antitoxin component (TIGR02293 family)
MTAELAAVVHELGGEAAVGRAIHSDEDLRLAIREGLPHSAVAGVLKSAEITLQELASSLDLSVRSLQRRRSDGRLARYESDRVYRLARIVALATYFLGEKQRALHWLKRPNRALGGVAPLSAIDTELGARTIENILGRIAYGGIS